MNVSAKWTTVTFIAASALGSLVFAFSGCTTTSGTVNEDGGPTTTSNPDSGGGGDSAATVSTCEGNTEDVKKVGFTDECQACLDAHCCTELKNCFNLPAGKDDAGADLADCNTYAACEVDCYTNVDAGDPDKCETDLCNNPSFSGKAVQDAYGAILTCGKTDCGTICGIQ